jgi:antitoxin MazE
MRVAKWGNSLAVRLPVAVVKALELKEGDSIEISVASDGALNLERDMSRERAIERLRALRRPLPAGFKFDREEANAR